MQVDPLSVPEYASKSPGSDRVQNLLSVRNLSCNRNNAPVFRDIAFNLSPGQILLIEGENGSGKTTLLRVLCGLLEPETGEVLWRGQEIRSDYNACLRDMCYIGHGNGVKLGLTPLENLTFAGDLMASDGNADPYAILKRFGLGRFHSVPTQYLSAGQRRRVALARLLLMPKAIWILDEPFTSLDEDGRSLLRTLFQDHLASRGAVIMTSHDPFAWEGHALQRIKLT